MISTPSSRTSLYRRVLHRFFPERTTEGITSAFLKATEALEETRLAPDRRQGDQDLPQLGGRRALDKPRAAIVGRASSDRRKEPRYVPLHHRAYLCWWRGDTLQTTQAGIDNLSRSGASALIGDLPCDVKTVWVCFLDSPRRDWYPAEVVGVGTNAQGGQTIRIALAQPLPYCVFKAVVWGFHRTDTSDHEATTMLVPPAGPPLPVGADFIVRPPQPRRPVAKATEAPSQVGHYRILKCLGSGGMGMVYLAEDSELERRVALKVMHPHLATDPSARQRFLREARAAAAIQHDNIVTIFQVGQHDETPFLAMQFLEGETLAAWLERIGRPSLDEVVRIGTEIAAGLAAAHSAGLIHRDIKPENVWLDARDQRVKLLDFGLARTVTHGPHLTEVGYILGTPAYMSPEQAMNEPCDHRSDLFSLGTVLYRLCGGELPFSGKSAFATLAAVTRNTPRPLKELNPDLPEDLAGLIGRLLEKNPAGRPADAESVVAVLQAVGSASRTTAPAIP